MDRIMMKRVHMYVDALIFAGLTAMLMVDRLPDLQLALDRVAY